MARKEDKRKDNALGVAVEARYTVGEYDIVILSAKESDGSRPGSASTATRSRPARAARSSPTCSRT
jgi:hypothetical protein